MLNSVALLVPLGPHFFLHSLTWAQQNTDAHLSRTTAPRSHFYPHNTQDGGSLVHPAADSPLFFSPRKFTFFGDGRPRDRTGAGCSRVIRPLGSHAPRPAGSGAGGDREEAGQNSPGAEQQEEDPDQEPTAGHHQPGRPTPPRCAGRRQGFIWKFKSTDFTPTCYFESIDITTVMTNG